MSFRRTFAFWSVLLLSCIGVRAQNPATFRVGLKSIAIPPPPTTTLMETGSDYRVLLDNLADVRNRLVAAFLLPDELTAIQTGKTSLSRYCLVEVLRGIEFSDVSPQMFQQFGDSFSQQFSAAVDGELKNEQEDINRKLKLLGSGSTSITLDKPLLLGRLYVKPNANGFGMIMPVNVNGTTKKVAAVISIIRIQDRLLFLYVYSPYTDEDSVKWAGSTSEKWVDAILAANK